MYDLRAEWCAALFWQLKIDSQSLDKDVMSPVVGNYRKVVMGDEGFGGKIQDLTFGSSLERTELSSKTYCGTQYKTIGSTMNKIEVII